MSHPDPNFDPENVRPNDWDAYESRIEDMTEDEYTEREHDEEVRREKYEEDSYLSRLAEK